MEKNWVRQIILFLSSQTLSLFGSALVQYAIMWHITLESKSGAMMTIYIVCGFLPTFFLSPFAGVWADRYNRKLLIILADSLIAAATLVMALLFVGGYDAMWLLFVIPAIRAAGTAVHMPAVAAFIPQLVPEDKLMKVNGANGTIQAMVMLIAPMISVGLLKWFSMETIFFIDVVTATIAILALLLFLKVPAHKKAQNKQELSYFRDMKDGFRYIGGSGYLKEYFVFSTFFLLLAAPVAFLTPLQVARTFGEDYWLLMAIEIAFSVGMMAGGVLIASWGGFKNKVYTMAASSFLIGLSTAAMGVAPLFWLYLIFMGTAGLSMPLFNTPSTVLLQERVESNYLGRVFGVMGMLSSAMMPLGMLFFGPLADVVAIEWLLIVSGLAITLLGFLLLASKALLEAGKPLERKAETSDNDNRRNGVT